MFGFHGEKVIPLNKYKVEKEDYVISLTYQLKSEGLCASKIKKILKKAKFDENLVNRVVDDIVSK